MTHPARLFFPSAATLAVALLLSGPRAQAAGVAAPGPCAVAADRDPCAGGACTKSSKARNRFTPEGQRRLVATQDVRCQRRFVHRPAPRRSERRLRSAAGRASSVSAVSPHRVAGSRRRPPSAPLTPAAPAPPIPAVDCDGSVRDPDSRRRSRRRAPSPPPIRRRPGWRVEPRRRRPRRRPRPSSRSAVPAARRAAGSAHGARAAVAAPGRRPIRRSRRRWSNRRRPVLPPGIPTLLPLASSSRSTGRSGT